MNFQTKQVKSCLTTVRPVVNYTGCQWWCQVVILGLVNNEIVALSKKRKAVCSWRSLKHSWVNRIEICLIPLSTERNVSCTEYRLPFLAGFRCIGMRDRDKSHWLHDRLLNYSLTRADPHLLSPSIPMRYPLFYPYPITGTAYAWRLADSCILG